MPNVVLYPFTVTHTNTHWWILNPLYLLHLFVIGIGKCVNLHWPGFHFCDWKVTTIDWLHFISISRIIDESFRIKLFVFISITYSRRSMRILIRLMYKSQSKKIGEDCRWICWRWTNSRLAIGISTKYHMDHPFLIQITIIFRIIFLLRVIPKTKFSI